MEIPAKIGHAAQRLRKGHRVNRITVRDFLRHFGAERRGAVKVQAIRNILDSLDIETDPDFETAWIDSPLRLRLKDGVVVEPASDGDGSSDSGRQSLDDLVLESTPSAVEEAEEQAECAPTTTAPENTQEANAERSFTEDPTFRIGRMPAANKRIISVDLNDPLRKAISLMLKHDFSQLPVMQGEREVKGIVTWKTIGSRLAMGCETETVGACREEPRIADSNRTLFDVISTIVDYGYVLVRDQRDRRITGIVTASDLSLEFRTLSEPFLLIREVELHVRKILTGKIGSDDFAILKASPFVSKAPQNLADLTFGDYQRLVQHPTIWPKLQLRIDAQVLSDLLESVRTIRNDVTLPSECVSLSGPV